MDITTTTDVTCSLMLSYSPLCADVNVEKMRRLTKLRGSGADFATALTREVFY